MSKKCVRNRYCSILYLGCILTTSFYVHSVGGCRGKYIGFVLNRLIKTTKATKASSAQPTVLFFLHNKPGRMDQNIALSQESINAVITAQCTSHL